MSGVKRQKVVEVVEDLEMRNQLEMLRSVIVNRTHFKEFYFGPYTLRLRHVPERGFEDELGRSLQSLDILQVMTVPDPRDLSTADQPRGRFEDICAFAAFGLDEQEHQMALAYAQERQIQNFQPFQKLFTSFMMKDCAGYVNPYAEEPQQSGILLRYRTVRFDDVQDFIFVQEDGGRRRRFSEYPADWWIQLTDLNRDRARHPSDIGWHFRTPNNQSYPVDATRQDMASWSWLMNPIDFNPGDDALIIAPLEIDGVPVGWEGIGDTFLADMLDFPLIVRVFGDRAHSQRSGPYKLGFAPSGDFWRCQIQIMPTWINFWHRRRVVPVVGENPLEELYAPLVMSTVGKTASYRTKEQERRIVKFIPRSVAECNMMIWNAIKDIFEGEGGRTRFKWGPSGPASTTELRNLVMDTSVEPPRLSIGSFSTERLFIVSYIGHDPKNLSRRVPSLQRLAGLAAKNVVLTQPAGAFDVNFFRDFANLMMANPGLIPFVLQSKLEGMGIEEGTRATCCSFSCHKKIDKGRDLYYAMKSHPSVVFCSKKCVAEMNSGF